MYSEKLKKFKRYSLGAKIVLICFFLFFVVELVIHVYPLLYVLNNSVKTSEEIYQDPMALTKTWSFVNYVNMFERFRIRRSIYFEDMLFNSLWQTVLWLTVNIGSSALLAYALAIYRFPGHSLIYGLMIFKQILPIFGTGGASFKLLSALNMINNPATIWIYWGSAFDYTAFILYGTFKGLSTGYTEAAKIDGASNFKILGSIVFPMMFPAILALFVSNFVDQWDNYQRTQIELRDYPNLAYGLFTFQRDTLWIEDGETIFYTALVASGLPGLVLYMSMQNLVVKNLTVGGLKG